MHLIGCPFWVTFHSWSYAWLLKLSIGPQSWIHKSWPEVFDPIFSMSMECDPSLRLQLHKDIHKQVCCMYVCPHLFPSGSPQRIARRHCGYVPRHPEGDLTSPRSSRGSACGYTGHPSRPTSGGTSILWRVSLPRGWTTVFLLFTRHRQISTEERREKFLFLIMLHTPNSTDIFLWHTSLEIAPQCFEKLKQSEFKFESSNVEWLFFVVFGVDLLGCCWKTANESSLQIHLQFSKCKLTGHHGEINVIEVDSCNLPVTGCFMVAGLLFQ